MVGEKVMNGVIERREKMGVSLVVYILTMKVIL